MTAAMKSRMECSASERTPRLPVTIARNTLSPIRRMAEPIEVSAAKRFSWVARPRISAIGQINKPEDYTFRLGKQEGGAAVVSTSAKRGNRDDGQASRLAVEAADFDFVKEQRR